MAVRSLFKPFPVSRFLLPVSFPGSLFRFLVTAERQTFGAQPSQEEAVFLAFSGLSIVLFVLYESTYSAAFS
jgi:hypothetical protein